VIVVVIAWFYLIPYLRLIVSPFSWTDLSKRGFLSPDKAAYYADYGKREYKENGKNCIEYFALKDGLPFKITCE